MFLLQWCVNLDTEFLFIPSHPIAPDFKSFQVYDFYSLHADKHNCITISFSERSVVDKKLLVLFKKCILTIGEMIFFEREMN